MGEYTTFTCSGCGYRAQRIRWGAGQADPRIRFLPALCTRCRNIIEVELTGRDVLVETFYCGKCSSPVLFFEKGESHECPRCKAPNLGIEQKGYW